MIDFTSSLYLGMHHPSRSLCPWKQISLGVPAALFTLPLADKVAWQLARLQGRERAVLAPSTLHLAWDLLDLLSEKYVMLYVDAGTYPILRWGVERATARGTPVRPFPHHDAEALVRLLRRDPHKRRRPVVVTDGWCPRCGEAAPVRAYLSAIHRYGGHLVLDDTQALGILGDAPTAEQPYGRGGGGLLRWAGVRSKDVTVIASLAKGFGVPVAVLSGSENLIDDFEQKSQTRVHCSPPSVAVLYAAAHALALNRTQDEARRRRLLRLVRHFRAALAEAGLSAHGGLFPVQTFIPINRRVARDLHRRLLQARVCTALLRASSGHGAELGFVLNARQHVREIDHAVDAIAKLRGDVLANRKSRISFTVAKESVSIENEAQSRPTCRTRSSGKPDTSWKSAPWLAPAAAIAEVHLVTR